MEIKIEIKDCSECPFWESERVYTADSFEMPFKWMCKKADNRVISGFVEWHDEVKIPDWCPCRINKPIKESNTESIYKKILKSNVVYFNGKIAKNRYGREEIVTSVDNLENAEVESWDEDTKTLYLKTKQ